jgi:formate hydrogenlyase subunit 3/multisubunit Na+/H+ antiporter MnhD subunit
VLGVTLAIVQHDIKKLLAYHSIENIGIIGMGMGVGVIGLATENPTLEALGFAGGFLHIFNHALFKSLLFFSPEIFTKNPKPEIGALGGLKKKMPKTALYLFVRLDRHLGLPV